MQISIKTIETCIDALESLLENTEENIICIISHDLAGNWVGVEDDESLLEIIAAGPNKSIGEVDIEEIQEFMDRREALRILKQKMIDSAYQANEEWK